MTPDEGEGWRPDVAHPPARRTGASRSLTVWPCGRVTSASASTPASATARTLAIATSRPARTSASSPSSAISSAASPIRSGGPRPFEPCANRRSYSSSASSPPAATPATISATAAATDSPAGTSARTCAATSAALSTVHSARTQALQYRVDLARLHAVGHRVGDQPRRRAGDLLADHQPVLAQRRPGGRQVDDPVHQPGQRRQLDRALDLHDLRLAAGALEV